MECGVLWSGRLAILTGTDTRATGTGQWSWYWHSCWYWPNVIPSGTGNGTSTNTRTGTLFFLYAWNVLSVEWAPWKYIKYNRHIRYIKYNTWKEVLWRCYGTSVEVAAWQSWHLCRVLLRKSFVSVEQPDPAGIPCWYSWWYAAYLINVINLLQLPIPNTCAECY